MIKYKVIGRTFGNEKIILTKSLSKIDAKKSLKRLKTEYVLFLRNTKQTRVHPNDFPDSHSLKIKEIN